MSKLREFAEFMAFCACCEGVETCRPGCTIKEDSEPYPAAEERYQWMLHAREALQEQEK